jgi:hypothetical protein
MEKEEFLYKKQQSVFYLIMMFSISLVLASSAVGWIDNSGLLWLLVVWFFSVYLLGKEIIKEIHIYKDRIVVNNVIGMWTVRKDEIINIQRKRIVKYLQIHGEKVFIETKDGLTHHLRVNQLNSEVIRQLLTYK